jgi:hypothetical protein
MVKKRNSEENRNASKSSQAEPQVPCAPAAPAPGYAASKGAPPSNTAPANYIDGSTCIFRTGIDSLYLSWAGMLELYPIRRTGGSQK